MRCGSQITPELPDIAAITLPADIVPERAGAAMAVSPLMPTMKAIGTRMIADCGLSNRFGIEVIAPALAEQEYIFM